MKSIERVGSLCGPSLAAALICGCLACGGATDAPPSGPSSDAGQSGSSDAGSSDAGSHDGGSSDAGSSDAGSSDAGSHDGGGSDAGGSDAGSHDGGGSDAGGSDAGSDDAGSSDAGSHDAGSSDAGSSDAGSSGPLQFGRIDVEQTDVQGNFTYSVAATLARVTLSSGTPPPPPPCPQQLTVTAGDCTASVFCIPPASDAGPPAYSFLNAGTIAVSGGSGPAGAATLTYGPIPFTTPPRSNYLPIAGNQRFYAGGDHISVSGAGGPDLPAFTAPVVVAPSDITLTSPAGCATGNCPDLDRTADLSLTWTGGGAGRVFVTYQTLGDTLVTLVSCTFNASGGTGTIPSALLSHLEKGDPAKVFGVYTIAPRNESASFLVGDVPVVFNVSATGSSGSITPSK